MFAKANSPSLGRSAIFLEKASLIITLEIKEELLLVMLFFGLRRLFGSLVFSGASKALPSPKAGAEIAVADVDGPPSLTDVPLPSPSLLSLASLE